MNFKIFIINESKQDIISIGYPEIIAKIITEKYSSKAFLISRWYKEYSFSNKEKDWFLRSHLTTDIPDLIELYNSNPTEKTKNKIKNSFFEGTYSHFFRFQLIRDITSGKIKDVSQYKNLSFSDAQYKYDRKRIFDKKEPLKTYPNGYKWIEIGKECHLVKREMKNCGRISLMSLDVDATMIVLFDKNNNPHVIVVYSPNQKRISGEEGVAGTEVKPIYHEYVLDLAEYLNVDFDYSKSKSKLLSLKYQFRNKDVRIEKIEKEDKSIVYPELNEYFKIYIGNNIYYSDDYRIISKEDFEKIKSENKYSDWDTLRKIFSLINTSHIEQKYGVQIMLIKDFLDKINQ